MTGENGSDNARDGTQAGAPGAVQGEGNYDAAREYDQGATEHARNPDAVADAAQAARDALDGPDGAELERAEEEGRSHARD